jgi:hypothetical protein
MPPASRRAAIADGDELAVPAKPGGNTAIWALPFLMGIERISAALTSRMKMFW